MALIHVQKELPAVAARDLTDVELFGYGSVAKAATHLAMSQPAASEAMPVWRRRSASAC